MNAVVVFVGVAVAVAGPDLVSVVGMLRRTGRLVLAVAVPHGVLLTAALLMERGL